MYGGSVVEIQPTPDERAAERLTPESLARAVAALREDGIVLVQDAVDLGHVAVLRERMLADVEAAVQRRGAQFNWTRGNLQQDPPAEPPYLFRDVLANPFAVQINREILGDGFTNSFYSGNTAMPAAWVGAEERQPPHADEGQLWPNLEAAPPASSIVVNVGLVPMSPENGSTEIWLGTHKDTSVTIASGHGEVSPEALEARRAVSPPFQAVVPLGAIVLRDMRLWHAGMPNRSASPRPMIAMIHYVSWWHQAPFRLHRSAEALLAGTGLRQNAVWFD